MMRRNMAVIKENVDESVAQNRMVTKEQRRSGRSELEIVKTQEKFGTKHQRPCGLCEQSFSEVNLVLAVPYKVPAPGYPKQSHLVVRRDSCRIECRQARAGCSLSSEPMIDSGQSCFEGWPSGAPIHSIASADFGPTTCLLRRRQHVIGGLIPEPSHAPCFGGWRDGPSIAPVLLVFAARTGAHGPTAKRDRAPLKTIGEPPLKTCLVHTPILLYVWQAIVDLRLAWQKTFPQAASATIKTNRTMLMPPQCYNQVKVAYLARPP